MSAPSSENSPALSPAGAGKHRPPPAPDGAVAAAIDRWMERRLAVGPPARIVRHPKSERMYSWMFIFGFIAVFGGAAVVAALNAKKRRESMERLSAEHGWQFVRNGSEYAAALGYFPLMNKGRLRRAYNVLHGGEGDEEFWLFDYRYTVGSGKHSRTHRQTVVAFPHLSADFPAFELRPEHVFHKLGSAFGYQDIDVPGHPAFSSRFLLRGKDASAIRELFDADLVRTLEAERPRCIEGAGSALLIYRHRETVNSDKLLAALDHARTFRNAFQQRASRRHSMPSIPEFETQPI